MSKFTRNGALKIKLTNGEQLQHRQLSEIDEMFDFKLIS